MHHLKAKHFLQQGAEVKDLKREGAVANLRWSSLVERPESTLYGE